MKKQLKRKAFGQHFLKDKKVIGQIVSSVEDLINKSKVSQLVEIGPGHGAITDPLIDFLKSKTDFYPQSFLVIEKDRDLVSEWKSKRPELQILESDFLNLDAKQSWLLRVPIGVVSNLPYSTGTAIFQSLARHPKQVAFMVLMFQAEVAQRLRAKPNTAHRGSLSVWSQNFWNIECLTKVPPGGFVPPPKVDSEVVIVVPRAVPHVISTAQNPDLWNQLLRECFAHRRKMLRSCLASNKLFKEALNKSGIDSTKRAQALDWEEWNAFFEAACRL